MDTANGMKKPAGYKKFFRILTAAGWGVFVLYSLLLVFELFLGRYRFSGSRSANLVPFMTISSYLCNREHLSRTILIINLVGNICVFIPMGILLPCLLKRFRSFWRILLLGVIMISCVESLQWLLNVGIFDIDDILLNVLGILTGYGLYKLADIAADKIKYGTKTT